jgi:FAD/FMN-containing dehydrogenase
MQYPSWGRYPPAAQQAVPVYWRDQPLPDCPPMLAYGQGRSYGDVCLNDGGTLMPTQHLDRFIHFDTDRGILRAEAGVTLAQVIALTLPRGWFLPVTPGTKFVSLGGAIANDVHGKNHHQAGSFGCHVRAFELLRSDGQRLLCTADTHAEYFQASIGGLGLTGLITWVEIDLKAVKSDYISQQTTRFANLGEFLELNEAMESQWEYTVAWIDCLARGRRLGRGLYMAGRHEDESQGPIQTIDQPSLKMPVDAPGFLLNRYSVSAFNRLYYHTPRKSLARVPYDGFFYPLDRIANWNRLYGKRGFFQYQCVLPVDKAEEGLTQILGSVAKSGQASFLSVLKKFGENKAPGLLSFPRPGFTLAMDMANHGTKTLHLLDRLDDITMRCNGAVYPAKDARMSAAAFRQYFPDWPAFSNYIDPAFSSGFWRRVNSETA